jgi:hypothetical protein
MKTGGILWFDNNPKTNLQQKVDVASNHFKKKYGVIADTCHVNPSVFSGTDVLTFVETKNGNVSIVQDRAILPGHLWVGVDNDEDIDLKPVPKESKNAE